MTAAEASVAASIAAQYYTSQRPLYEPNLDFSSVLDWFNDKAAEQGEAGLTISEGHAEIGRAVVDGVKSAAEGFNSHIEERGGVWKWTDLSATSEGLTPIGEVLPGYRALVEIPGIGTIETHGELAAAVLGVRLLPDPIAEIVCSTLFTAVQAA